MAIEVGHDGTLAPGPTASRPRIARPIAARRARTGRGVLAGVALALLAILALVGSAILHLATELGREAARDGMVGFLSSRIRGEAHIGEITHLDFSILAMTDFRIQAPDGETVIQAERMAGVFDWGELFEHGTIQLAPGYIDRAEIWLTPGPDGQVNMVHAMEVPDERWTVPFEVNDIQLIGGVMHVALPGKPAMTMREVNGFADLHLGHLLLMRMDGIRGYADLSPFEAGFRHLSGRLRSDHAHPLVAQLLLDVEIAEPGARLDYHAPAVVGEAGEAYLELDTPVEIGVSDHRDDCAEGSEEHCAPARAEERERADQRERRAPARERAQARQEERHGD